MGLEEELFGIAPEEKGVNSHTGKFQYEQEV